MFDRPALFRKAWKRYNEFLKWAGASARFSRREFGHYLRDEWRDAKFAIADAARIVAEAPQVLAIRNELLAMELSDAPVNADRHRNLRIELMRASLPA